MSAFSSADMERKLNELSNTQQSIQTLSLWMIHHRKHAKVAVHIWFRELQRVKPLKKLNFIYVANDVLQNSKRKGPEYIKEFMSVLPLAFRLCARECDEKVTGSMARLLGIWKDRDVYDKIFLEKLTKALEVVKDRGQVDEVLLQPDKKAKVEPKPPTECADYAEMAQRLQGLMDLPSLDGETREKISSMTTELYDPGMLDKIRDATTARKLLDRLAATSVLLNDYNRRLADELEERQRVREILSTFTQAQKFKLRQSELLLDEHKARLLKVTSVEKELQAHLNNLPDLSKLPTAASLPPLPPPGELFKK